jgi:basic membrane protein A
MRKSNKMLSALTISTVLGLVAVSCGSDKKSADTTAAPTTAAATTAAPTTAAATTAAPTTAGGSETTAASSGTGGDASKVTACEVTDLGGADDKGFNESAYAGVTQAEKELGTKGELLESKSEADYATNIQSFLEKDCSVIITVGFLLDSATATAAKANPDQPFAIVDSLAQDNNGTPNDFSDDKPLPNVRPLTFSTDQPSFLAGYLAASVSKSGKVATYGGINIPTVTIFMDGFLHGVQYYNKTKDKNVEVLGWDGKQGSFVGNFDSQDDGKKQAQSFADEGADIVFPVAGPVGLGSAAYAAESGKVMIIGVDTDQYVSNPKNKSVYLTSVLKGIQAAVFDTIKNIVDTGKPGDKYLGTLENEGVALGEFHDHDKDVPQEVKDELKQLQDDIIAGKIDVTKAS